MAYNDDTYNLREKAIAHAQRLARAWSEPARVWEHNLGYTARIIGEDDDVQAYGKIVGTVDALGVWHDEPPEPRNVHERIEAKIEELKLDANDLFDDMVHETAAEHAAAINNGGLYEQIDYLLDNGVDEGNIIEFLEEIEE